MSDAVHVQKSSCRHRVATLSLEWHEPLNTLPLCWHGPNESLPVVYRRRLSIAHSRFARPSTTDCYKMSVTGTRVEQHSGDVPEVTRSEPQASGDVSLPSFTMSLRRVVLTVSSRVMSQRENSTNRFVPITRERMAGPDKTSWRLPAVQTILRIAPDLNETRRGLGQRCGSILCGFVGLPLLASVSIVHTNRCLRRHVYFMSLEQEPPLLNDQTIPGRQRTHGINGFN